MVTGIILLLIGFLLILGGFEAVAYLLKDLTAENWIFVIGLGLIFWGSSKITNWVTRLLERRRNRGTMESSAVGALRKPIDPESDLDPNMSKTRRGRHEAGHAVIAACVGATNISGNIRVVGDRGGRVSWKTDHLGPLNASWANMLAALAGNQIDLASGYHDGGSVGDIGRFYADVMLLVSADARPYGYTGDVTSDGLLRYTREVVTKLVEQNIEAIRFVENHLVEEGDFDDVYEILKEGGVELHVLPEEERRTIRRIHKGFDFPENS